MHLATVVKCTTASVRQGVCHDPSAWTRLRFPDKLGLHDVGDVVEGNDFGIESYQVRHSIYRNSGFHGRLFIVPSEFIDMMLCAVIIVKVSRPTSAHLVLRSRFSILT